MATFSFLDVQAAIVGPGGAFQLGNGAGTAEEGISYSFEGDKDSLTVGADGTPMHVLNASKAGEVLVRMIKTSPANKQLTDMYNLQTLTSTLHGNNTITIRDKARGDVITCRSCAFRRMPPNAYGKAGNTIEWAFTAGYIDVLLGSGTPEVLNA